MSAPPPDVLEAFGAHGAPVLMPGGQGRTWQVGDLVLKPVEGEVEHAWVAEVYDAWTSDAVRVPRPVRVDGQWCFAGWGAHVLVPGTTTTVSADPDWFRAAHEAFHDAVAHLDRPAFLDDRDDAWSYGDRLAWEGAPLRGAPSTRALLQTALQMLVPLELPSQVVHGDLCVNMLRDGDMPGVIDWPTYHRPRGWALAVVATDAVRWEGAPLSLLDQWDLGATWPQLLVRAVVYRLATRAWFESVGLASGQEDGYSMGVAALLAELSERLR